MLRPSSGYPSIYSARRDADAPARICDSHRDAFQFNNMLASGIVCLLDSCSPAAVCGRIVAVIVYPIKSESFRALSHVLKKIRKAISPSFTNGNASATIVGIGRNVPIMTASFHRGPDAVFSAIFVSFCKSVSGCLKARQFTPQTSATFSQAAPEIIPHHSYGLSAFAQAQPVAVFSRIWNLALRLQSSVSFAREVHWKSHVAILV